METNREEFMALLSRLKPALRGSGMPSFDNIWFDGEALSAYDGGLGIRIKHKTDLECGLPGAALLGLLDTSVLPEVTLDPSEKFVTVKMGKSSSKLACHDLDSQHWPFPESLPKKQAKLTLGEDFIEALRKVLFVKASKPSRVEHHGVVLECDEDKLFLYTTDSLTMASTYVDVEGKLSTVLLPRAFAEQIVSQAPSGVDLYSLTNVKVGGDTTASCLIAKGEDITLYSNLLDISSADDLGEIVSTQQEKHSRPVEIPAGLDGALARAMILAGKEEASVLLTVDKEGLTVSGNYALGQLKEVLALEGKHPAVKFRGDAGQIRRALVHSDHLSLTGASIILRGEPNFLYIAATVA